MTLSDGPHFKESSHTKAQSPTKWNTNVLMSTKVHCSREPMLNILCKENNGLCSGIHLPAHQF